MTDALINNTSSKQPTKEQFQVARCAFLDGFADVEQAIIALHSCLGLTDGNLALSQRLEALRKLKPGPTFSKAKSAILAAATERLAWLNALRADVVHARMSVAPVAGQMRACFINSRQCTAEIPSARLITLDQFHNLGKELTCIAGVLSNLIPISPASSPPPPSLGAATDL